MDANNWEPAQGVPKMEANSWQTQFSSETRQNNVFKIIERLVRYVPGSSQQVVSSIENLALKFEETTFLNSESQNDYMQKISSKMHSLDTQNVDASLVAESSCTRESPSDQGQMSEDDWREEIYQKIKTMRDRFYPQLKEMYHKLAVRFQQLASLQTNTVEQEKVKRSLDLARVLVEFLNMSKDKIPPTFKGKMGIYEKNIINLLRIYGSKRSTSSTQKGEPPQLAVQPLQPQSQYPQVQSNGNQINLHLESTNVYRSTIAVKENNETSLRHDSIVSFEATTSQKNIMNSLNSGTRLNARQGNDMNSLLQYPASTPRSSTLSLQCRQNSESHQANLNMLHSMHLKQHKELRMIKAQQAKQQHKVKQPLMKHNLLIEQQHPHQPAELQTRHAPQHHFAGQCSIINQQQLKLSPPQLLHVASSQIPQHSFPEIDQKHSQTAFTKAGTPLQYTSSSSAIASPSTPLAPSHIIRNPEKRTSSALLHSRNTGFQHTTVAVAAATPGLLPSSVRAVCNDLDGNHDNMLANDFCESTVAEKPIQRLIRVVGSMSGKALSASVCEMESVVNLVERTAGSLPGTGSRSKIGEDLADTTKHRLEGRYYNNAGMIEGRRKLRRYISAVPSCMVSSAGSVNERFKQQTDSEIYDSESTATSSKRSRIQGNYSLSEEIRKINQRLINTVVDISDEGVTSMADASLTEVSKGTIVKCSFRVVPVSPDLNSCQASANMLSIQPLRLLVPTNYPNCSPILLDKLSLETSMNDEDLSAKAKSQLSIHLQGLEEPMSLEDMALAWDVCTHTVFREYAQQNGGGDFSSEYGTWENCLSLA